MQGGGRFNYWSDDFESLSQNAYQGVWVYENGRGTFENNTLRANKRGAWDIAADCLPNVKRSGNIEK